MGYVPRQRLTLEKFLWTKWLPVIKPTIRTNTYLGYASHVRCHICPHIGKTRLDRVDGSIINSLYAALLERGRVNGGGLSLSTVRRVHATLHRAFRDAVRWGLIDKNPADNADPPKLRSSQQISTWSAREVRSFLDSVRDDPHFSMWLLLATTGMRRGEVLGLRWCDLDLEHGQLAVRQTVVTNNYQVEISEPKTARGRRVVALDHHSLEELRRYRAAVEPCSGDELLFCDRAGDPLNPVDVSKDFVALARVAGLRRIRLHDLRHTHATLALQAGVHPKIVSERLGHSTVSFTLDVYSHAIPHLQKEAASQIASLVFPEGI